MPRLACLVRWDSRQRTVLARSGKNGSRHQLCGTRVCGEHHCAYSRGRRRTDGVGCKVNHHRRLYLPCVFGAESSFVFRPRMTWLRFSLVEVVDEHSRQAPVETLPLIGVTSCRLVELMPTPRLNLGASSFGMCLLLFRPCTISRWIRDFLPSDRIELHTSMPMLEEGVLSSFLSVASTGGSMRMSLKGRPILHVHSCLPSPLSQLPSRNTLPLFRLSLTVNRGVYAVRVC